MGLEGGAHHDGVSALLRRERHQICLFLSCEDIARRWPSASQKILLMGHQNCQDCDLRLASFQIVRNKSLLFKLPIYDILLQQPELTKRVSNSRSDFFFFFQLQCCYKTTEQNSQVVFSFLQGNFKKKKKQIEGCEKPIGSAKFASVQISKINPLP